MDLFKIIVVLVAFFILIVVLTLVGFLIQTADGNSIYPPTVNQCPNQWMTDGSSNCIIPVSHNVGTMTDFSKTPGFFINEKGDKVINFADNSWSSNGVSPQCNKRLWSNTNNIIWDTISNYNQC
jgi:hypothetical protein